MGRPRGPRAGSTATPSSTRGPARSASYFKVGEYQAEAPLPVPARVAALAESAGRFWRDTLGQGGRGNAGRRIPFIDFARGDGRAIGPGQEREWTATPISDATPWVSRYRGMWGLYAQDPIAGENAPAGPMYNRDGSPRPSWFDPLGFAELDQVPPPTREPAALEAEVAELHGPRRGARRARRRGDGGAAAPRRGPERDDGERPPRGAARAPGLRVTEQTAVVKGLLRERAETAALLDGLARRIERSRTARADGPHDHIRHPMEPVTVERLRFHRATELWAALSVSALLIALAAFVLFAPADVWAAVIVLVLAFLIGESVLRGTFTRVVNRIAVVLALISVVVLLVEFWKVALVALLLGFAVFLIYQRVRERRG